MNTLLALLKQLLGLLKKEADNQTVPDVANPPMTPVAPAVPMPTHYSKIPLWAAGIQLAEGWNPNLPSRSCKNHNPGNIKFTHYSGSLGAVGKDADNFAVFPTDRIGNNALQQLLTDACNDKLIAFKSNMTLDHFTDVYAMPPSTTYVNIVAKTIGCDPKVAIKTLL